VVLLYDLGSAKMKAEIAIELAESIEVKLVEAPLVEGSYVAVVEASMGKAFMKYVIQSKIFRLAKLFLVNYCTHLKRYAIL